MLSNVLVGAISRGLRENEKAGFPALSHAACFICHTPTLHVPGCLGLSSTLCCFSATKALLGATAALGPKLAAFPVGEWNFQIIII